MNRQLKKMAEEEHVIYLDIHSLLLEEGRRLSRLISWTMAYT